MTESRAASSLITSSDDLDSNLDIVVDMEGAQGGQDSGDGLHYCYILSRQRYRLTRYSTLSGDNNLHSSAVCPGLSYLRGYPTCIIGRTVKWKSLTVPRSHGF